MMNQFKICKKKYLNRLNEFECEAAINLDYDIEIFGSRKCRKNCHPFVFFFFVLFDH